MKENALGKKKDYVAVMVSKELRAIWKGHANFLLQQKRDKKVFKNDITLL